MLFLAPEYGHIEMNHEQITERIRNLRTQPAASGPACPDEHQVAAAIDGELNWDDRDAFDQHVANCDYCITRIGSLNGLRAVEVVEEVPDITLARARRLAKRTGTIQHAPRWAAAAVVVLAMVFTFGKYSNDNIAPESPASLLPPVATVPQSRNIDPDALRPRILAPHEGAVIDAGKTLFRWTEIPGSLYYDIRIITGEGDMVWQDRINDTEWALPGHFELEPGAQYYVRVDAYLAEAKSVSSRHLLFTVKGQP